MPGEDKTYNFTYPKKFSESVFQFIDSYRQTGSITAYFEGVQNHINERNQFAQRLVDQGKLDAGQANMSFGLDIKQIERIEKNLQTVSADPEVKQHLEKAALYIHTDTGQRLGGAFAISLDRAMTATLENNKGVFSQDVFNAELAKRLELNGETSEDAIALAVTSAGDVMSRIDEAVVAVSKHDTEQYKYSDALRQDLFALYVGVTHAASRHQVAGTLMTSPLYADARKEFEAIKEASATISSTTPSEREPVSPTSEVLTSSADTTAGKVAAAMAQ